MLREKIFDAWWSRALIYGVTFGLLTGMFNGVFHHKGLKESVIIGVLGGVFFGLFMSVVMGRLMNLRKERVGDLMVGLPPENQIAARRASSRGPIPSDPQVRSAAAALARDHLDQLNRHAILGLVLFGGLDLVYVALAIWASPWWWLAVALFTVFIALQLWQPGHLRRRLARLDQSPPVTVETQSRRWPAAESAWGRASGRRKLSALLLLLVAGAALLVDAFTSFRWGGAIAGCAGASLALMVALSRPDTKSS